VDSGWTVGHLEAEHIRPDLFEDVVDATETGVESVAIARAETVTTNEMEVAVQ
jgi:hypothetical protein